MGSIRLEAQAPPPSSLIRPWRLGQARTSSAKVPLDASDQTLEHLSHLAGPPVGEPPPGELAVVLVPGSVRADEVEVPVQSQSDDILCPT